MPALSATAAKVTPGKVSGVEPEVVELGTGGMLSNRSPSPLRSPAPKTTRISSVMAAKNSLGVSGSSAIQDTSTGMLLTVWDAFQAGEPFEGLSASTTSRSFPGSVS
mgnify:CR=1 FL=1